MKTITSLKGFIAIIALSFLMLGSAQAQKYAYVNSQYILDNIPDYKTAMQTLDNVSWRGLRANQGIFLQKRGSNNDFMCGTV